MRTDTMGFSAVGSSAGMLPSAVDAEPDDPVAAAVDELLAAARTTAAVHIPEEGLCRGCLETSARLAPPQCEYAQWAAAVLAVGRDVLLAEVCAGQLNVLDRVCV